MSPINFGAILLTALVFVHNTAGAVEFQECSKFSNTDKHKYTQCIGYSFREATQAGNHLKAIQWLKTNRNETKYTYNELLASLMCGNEVDAGSKPFRGNRQEIMRLTDDLVKLGASFDAMPMSYLVTPLFCITNRKDSVILNHALTRINATSKDLNASLYEGIDPSYVPLFRAVMNNDLASAKVLIKHGSATDFSIMENETALKKALELRHIAIANWLLDIGASVHKHDDQAGCTGKSALDYALEIPSNVQGRDQIIARIKQLMTKPSAFKNKCTALGY